MLPIHTSSSNLLTESLQDKTNALTIIYLTEGEDVEYDIVIDSNKGDKKSAANVTGPDGGNVIGTPRRDAQPRSRRDDNDDRY